MTRKIKTGAVVATIAALAETTGAVGTAVMHHGGAGRAGATVAASTFWTQVAQSATTGTSSATSYIMAWPKKYTGV